MAINDALATADSMGLSKGSIFRGGRSCVGLGSDVDASLAAGASETFTIEVDEDTVLGRMFIAAEVGLPTLTVTDIKIAGDSLVSSKPVPASMFAENAVNSPTFGHPVSSDTKIAVTIRNNSGTTAATIISVGFSAI